jgi:hypothetical protein
VSPALVSFVSGVVFALGLGISGMTRPAKVLGFLDLAGPWDPSLAFVMGGAIAVFSFAYWALARETPLLAPRFAVVPRGEIDRRLVGGALLFGVGWGLGGLCPGPAVVSIVSARAPALVFVISMLAGMWLFAAIERRRAPQDG